MSFDVRGWDQARRLGHHWVGNEHALLALACGDTVAGGVLREAGATPERLEELIAHDVATSDPPIEPRSGDLLELTPAHYTTRGRAEGLAVATGAACVGPEHELLALLWSDSQPRWLLHRLDADAGSLVRALARSGVVVPPGEPPALDHRPKRRVDVPYGQLATIVAELPGRLPEGAHFGFNVHHETERAWIEVDENVDGEELVEAILSRPV